MPKGKNDEIKVPTDVKLSAPKSVPKEERKEIKKKAPIKPKKVKFKVLFGFVVVNGVSVRKGECAVVSADQFNKEFLQLVEKEIIEEV